MKLIYEENWKRFVQGLNEMVNVKRLDEVVEQYHKEYKGGAGELFYIWHNYIWKELYPIQYLSEYMTKARFNFLAWLNENSTVFPCRSYNGYRWVKGYREGKLKVLQITEDITDATPVPDTVVEDWLKEYEALMSKKPAIMDSSWEWFLCSSAMEKECRAFCPEELGFLLTFVVKELKVNI